MNIKITGPKRGLIFTPKGWKKLQDAKHDLEIQEKSGNRFTLEELSERTELDPRTVAKVLEREQGVDKRTLEQLFSAFNLKLDKSDYSKPVGNFEELEDAIPITRQDLREAVDVSIFYGRTEELAKLEQWIFKDCCRIVALLGMGGIGKTALSAKLAERIKPRFEYVIWRSLLHAPSLQDLLANLLQFLANEQETEMDLPESLHDKMLWLTDYFRNHRCLLVLDNAEAILQSGKHAGHYREGYEGYGELLKLVGEASHQSCLLVTSREQPREVASLTGEPLPVRSLQLSGLKKLEGQAILKAKGFSGSKDKSDVLIEHYAGNPLALKIVATTIQDMFAGNITEFLSQNTAVFGDIRDMLDQQFNRLSALEMEIMYWLAINREPVSLSGLREDFAVPVSQPKLLEALESLFRRSLLEKSAIRFTLQPVVMEYMTERLIEQVCQEIATQKLKLFNTHALIKAQGKNYVRNTQVRLILKPLIDGLLTHFRSKRSIENQLNQILSMLRSRSRSFTEGNSVSKEDEKFQLELGYTGGNILNLLCQLELDLSNHDFSHLTVWQADLQHANFHNSNFSYGILALGNASTRCRVMLSEWCQLPSVPMVKC